MSSKTQSTHQWLLKLIFVVLMIIVSQPLYAGVNIQHWTTDNGARVYFVAAPELPMVDAHVIFDAGAARDNKNGGVAILTNALLAEGAGGLNANQISERFDELGVRFSTDAQRDMAALKLRSLSEPGVLQNALETLALVLTEPEFPEEAFQRERKRLLVGIEQRKQSPGALADEAFYKAIYKNHPYSAMPMGYENSVKSLNIDDLKAFYKRYYVSANAVIAIVGDLNRSEAEQLAEKIIARLPKGERAEALPSVTIPSKAENVKIEHPSAQTHILVGQPGMKRGDPDYFALYIGNHILGGNGLVSRLSNEIREKRGLSYSSYSYFLPMRQNGPYTIGLQTRTEQVDEALNVLRQTVSQFIENGPSNEELAAAKKNITGGFPLRIASNKKIIGYIGMIGFYGLPLNYLDTFNAKINAINVETIQDAFKRRLNPDKMVTVLVGKI
ncbi:MAG: insulinase family protein [Gammaproteobacteria bacterium]|nr:insulinase family protein [Gammaproteobacteria bacterium]